MKLKIAAPAVALLLLAGGYSVSAASNTNNGIPEKLAELQTTVSNLVNEVTGLLPLKTDVKSVKDSLATVLTTISEQRTEINSLKKEITVLKSSTGIVEPIKPEVKAAILQAVKNNIGYFTTYYWNDSNNPDPYSFNEGKINVVNYDIKEIVGKEVLQIYTEGNYDWTSAVAGQNDGNGFSFARNFIFNCDPIFKTLGANLDYEFYQNGEKVTPIVAH